MWSCAAPAEAVTCAAPLGTATVVGVPSGPTIGTRNGRRVKRATKGGTAEAPLAINGTGSPSSANATLVGGIARDDERQERVETEVE